MDIDSLNNEIKNNDAVLVYFSGEYCGVCEVLSPKIKDAISTHFPKIKQLYISASDFKQTAANFSVFSMPTIIIYFDGKEFIKQSRHISVSGLVDDIQRPYNLFFED